MEQKKTGTGAIPGAETWVNAYGERARLQYLTGWNEWYCDLGCVLWSRAYKRRKCAENYLRRCGYEREEQMTHQLVVIYADGQKQTFDYESRADAERAERGMSIALGEQIRWSCVRVKV